MLSIVKKHPTRMAVATVIAGISVRLLATQVPQWWSGLGIGSYSEHARQGVASLRKQTKTQADKVASEVDSHVDSAVSWFNALTSSYKRYIRPSWYTPEIERALSDVTALWAEVDRTIRTDNTELEHPMIINTGLLRVAIAQHGGDMSHLLGLERQDPRDASGGDMTSTTTTTTASQTSRSDDVNAAADSARKPQGGEMKDDIYKLTDGFFMGVRQESEKGRESGGEYKVSRVEFRGRFITESMRFLDFASRAYEGAGSTGIPFRDILLEDLQGSELRAPRHLVAIDHLTRSIVVAVRGTFSFADVITDLAARSVPCPELGGYCHEGILHAATALIDRVDDAVHEGISRYPAYRIVVTGHSLGAGTAILLTMLLQRKRQEYHIDQRVPLRCYAFAPPPCYGPLDSIPKPVDGDDMHIYTFVHNVDVVPRASFSSLFAFAEALHRIDALPLTPLQRMQILANPTSYPGEVQAVMDAITQASRDSENPDTTASVAAAATAKSKNKDKGSEYRPLYVPGHIYSLTPVNAKATRYTVHQVDTTRLADNLPYAGESLVMDHLATSYLKGFERAHFTHKSDPDHQDGNDNDNSDSNSNSNNKDNENDK
eukprot:TRINITY_DN14074_c0_g1_i1.p1 TRINITY_DN14074_c0_g1~~TRINITY_DN14074_c0_g1_i1.p1  ORF type:complete len:602 (+),score=108.89 TRINITY_DN14074_c0_g1_i1:159-1964(+)